MIAMIAVMSKQIIQCLQKIKIISRLYRLQEICTRKKIFLLLKVNLF